MKTLQKYFGLMVVAAGPFFATHSLAGGVCRAFSDTQGRMVKGQLMGFDGHKQLVTIQRVDNSKPCKAPLAVFSDTDQQYIQAWDFERQFNHSLRLSTFRTTYPKPESVGTKHHQTKSISNMGYKVKLANESTTRFELLEVEYCVFYRQGKHQDGSILFDEGVLYERCMIELIMPASETSLKTEPVLILNETGDMTSFGRTEGARGEVLGLWLRVHATSPSGNVITREHCSPPGLSSLKAWTSETVAAGLNHDNKGTTAPAIRLSTVTMPSIGRLTLE